MQLYLGALIFSLVAVCLLESLRPLRPVGADAPRRWARNLALALLATGATLYTPLLLWAALRLPGTDGQHFGGLLAWLQAPAWLAWALTFLVLDFTSYLLHRLAHALPWLWRLHAIHHSDTELDATTTHRHHPLEAAVGALLQLPVLLLLLGAPPLAVLAYAVAQTVVSTFAHGNFSLGPAGQRWLGWLLVTPDFHRMHHSAERRFTNSNYGMLLSCWDRWLGTASAPCLGEPARRLVLGLEYFRAPAEQRLGRMLAQPFGRQGFGRAAAPDDQKAIN